MTTGTTGDLTNGTTGDSTTGTTGDPTTGTTGDPTTGTTGDPTTGTTGDPTTGTTGDPTTGTTGDPTTGTTGDLTTGGPTTAKIPDICPEEIGGSSGACCSDTRGCVVCACTWCISTIGGTFQGVGTKCSDIGICDVTTTTSTTGDPTTGTTGDLTTGTTGDLTTGTTGDLTTGTTGDPTTGTTGELTTGTTGVLTTGTTGELTTGTTGVLTTGSPTTAEIPDICPGELEGSSGACCSNTIECVVCPCTWCISTIGGTFQGVDTTCSDIGICDVTTGTTSSLTIEAKTTEPETNGAKEPSTPPDLPPWEPGVIIIVTLLVLCAIISCRALVSGGDECDDEENEKRREECEDRRRTPLWAEANFGERRRSLQTTGRKGGPINLGLRYDTSAEKDNSEPDGHRKKK